MKRRACSLAAMALFANLSLNATFLAASESLPFPERGFVSSANQHPVGPSYPYYVFNDGYDTYRSRVINNFFRSKEQFDVEDFKS